MSVRGFGGVEVVVIGWKVGRVLLLLCVLMREDLFEYYILDASFPSRILIENSNPMKHAIVPGSNPGRGILIPGSVAWFIIVAFHFTLKMTRIASARKLDHL